jgi:hypothetical protein
VTKNYAAAKEALADMPPRCSPLPARAERASDACLFVCWTVPSVMTHWSVPIIALGKLDGGIHSIAYWAPNTRDRVR